MSNDLAVQLRGVSKSYTVYAKPRYWLAEFLGLGRFLREGRHFRSFWALRDIDLDVPRGAKVAIVGRNGAGKSTLLRIISDNVATTTGTVAVNGRCEALMQLGTGFNPEFTGRECVRVALAYMGVTGQEAEERLGDVLEFSELDEFIDQPVRTYSSGMYLRLAFSVATMNAPEVLIIDEVLGAGDLYFQAKCLARIQSLASGPGTTVLFVSHDLEAAQRLCDTFVWIDRGRIVARGPAAEVRAAYEDSIRRQQEIRMRARNLRLSQGALLAMQAAGGEGSHILGQVVLETSERATGPQVHAIRLFIRGAQVEEIRVGDAMDDASGHYPSFVISDSEDPGWGPPQKLHGRLARVVRHGGGGVGARFALFLPHEDFGEPGFEVALGLEYRDASDVPAHVELNAATAGMKRLTTLEHAADGAWKTARVTVPRWIYARVAPVDAASEPALAAGGSPAAGDLATVPRAKRFGTGQVRMDRVRFLNAEGRDGYVFEHGRRMVIEISYYAEDPSLIGSTMVCSASFLGLDGVRVSAAVSAADGCRFPVRTRGCIRLIFDPLLLCNGTYRVSVGLLSQMDLHGYDPHYTVSPFLYDHLTRALELVVEGAYPAESWIFRHPIRWEDPGEVG